MLGEYVIGVDGGGAKTTALLADLQGKILARAKTGSSHPRYLGIKKAADSVAFVIEKILEKIGKNGKISATFLGLPGIEEEFKAKRGLVKKELLRHKKISRIFEGKVMIGSDQLAGFRSGTDEKDGLALIGGSGSTCHGWKGGREIKIDGWGYLSETGSAFFIGRRTLQTVLKEVDGRRKKTLLAKKVLRGLGVKNKEQLIRLVYSKFPMEIIPSISLYCNAAAEAGEKSARNILIDAGKELALSAKTAINELSFSKNKFPLVLVGSMFNSRIILDVVKKGIKKSAPKVNFIRPEVEPAVGAVKLAISMALDEIAENLRKGKVIVCPTDTVYGLVAAATDKKAVDKIFKIKKRLKTVPLPIFVDNLDEARKLAIIGEKQERFLKKVWPGKTTVVLKRKTKTKLYGVVDETIALRVPKYKLVNDLLAKARIPLIGTSANISGKPATGRIKEVLKQFQGKKFQPDLIVGAGNLERAKPSTVISLISSKPKILRK
jgi:tRNA threonylcarbamoyl adenosine modification protein (Sua5/YciO/YrdC/YwlC family)